MWEFKHQINIGEHLSRLESELLLEFWKFVDSPNFQPTTWQSLTKKPFVLSNKTLLKRNYGRTKFFLINRTDIIIIKAGIISIIWLTLFISRFCRNVGLFLLEHVSLLSWWLTLLCWASLLHLLNLLIPHLLPWLTPLYHTLHHATVCPFLQKKYLIPNVPQYYIPHLVTVVLYHPVWYYH